MPSIRRFFVATAIVASAVSALRAKGAVRTISVNSAAAAFSETYQLVCEASSCDGFKLHSSIDASIVSAKEKDGQPMEITETGLVQFPKQLRKEEGITIQLTYMHFDTRALSFTSDIPCNYEIDSQRTRIKATGLSKITSHSDIAGKTEKKGNQVTYGPFPAPVVQEQVTVYFLHTECISIPALKRHIQLSHTASEISVEDSLTLANMCPAVDKFSRLDYSISQYGRGQAEEYTFPIPRTRSGAYVVDHIGNVSTSKLGRKLAIRPRYPLMGGWKYAFQWGYSIRQEDYVRSLKSGDYVVKLPIMEIPQNVLLVNSSEINVVLPQGATDPVVLSKLGAYSYDILPAKEFKSYLDSTGRVQIRFKASQLTDELLLPSDIYIQYKYEALKILQKPMAVAAFCMVIFLLAGIIRRIRTSFVIPKHHHHHHHHHADVKSAPVPAVAVVEKKN